MRAGYHAHHSLSGAYVPSVYTLGHHLSGHDHLEHCKPACLVEGERAMEGRELLSSEVMCTLLFTTQWLELVTILQGGKEGEKEL